MPKITLVRVGSLTIPPPPPPTGLPTASTTGSSGTLTSGTVNLSANGAVYSNRNITNGGDPLYVDGDNMQFINCTFPSSNVVFANSNGTTVTNCTFGSGGIGVSSTSNLTLDRVKVMNYTSDSLHITSDAGSMCTNVTVRDSYFYNSNPAPGAHSDGVQIRGSLNLHLDHNVFDQGPTFSDLKNAAVFFEEANGGNSAFLVENNYFHGGGYWTAYLDSGSGVVQNNIFVFPNGGASGGMFFPDGTVSPGISGNGNVDGNGNPITFVY